MNIYEKLAAARVELQSAGLKKSGRNSFSKYDYFELTDFLPAINRLAEKYKFTPVINYAPMGEMATLSIIDSEKPEDKIVFNSPMAEATLKGAHPIQNLGAVETYTRRYLYMVAFEIAESDTLDAVKGSNMLNLAPTAPKKKQAAMSKEKQAELAEAMKAYEAATGASHKAVWDSLRPLVGEDVMKWSDADADKAILILKDGIKHE